jgi:RNA polymerase sigma-70 factor (ECF subfamily)
MDSGRAVRGKLVDDSVEILDLLERAGQGEPGAFAELFARYREPLRQAVALRLDRRVLARVDVSDVVQETCMEAARRLADYLAQRPLPFALWLRWLAREQVLAAHRQHLLAEMRAVGREAAPLPAESSVCFVSALLGKEPSPSQAVVAAEAAEKLRLALGQLDDEERDLILWRHFEHLSNREIAQLLGVTEAAGGKRYIRALERLRGLLLGLGVSGPG